MKEYIGKNVEVVLENGHIFKGKLVQGLTPTLTTKYYIELDNNWSTDYNNYFSEDEVKSITVCD